MRARRRQQPELRERERERNLAYNRSGRRKPRNHRAWYQQNRDKSYISWLRKSHGMRPEDWMDLWDAQDGRCYLCSEEMEQPNGSRKIGLGSATVVIDHDHSHCPRNTSCRICRRGLAHTWCNLGIGKFGDDPTRLRRAADALEAALLEVQNRKHEAFTLVPLF